MKKIIFMLILSFANILNCAQASEAELKRSAEFAVAAPRTTELINAVIDDKVDKVAQLIKSGVNMNAQASDGQTALHWAINNMTKEAAEGATEIPQIVKLLLAQPKIDVNIQDENGFTPLVLAILANNPKLVAMLLSDEIKIKKAKVNGIRSFRGRIHVINNLTNIFRQGLLNSSLKEADMMKVLNFNNAGFTPLMHAIRIGNPKIVEQLLLAGADFDATYNEISPTGEIIKSEPIDLLMKDKPDIKKLIDWARQVKEEAQRELEMQNEPIFDNRIFQTLISHPKTDILSMLLGQRKLQPNIAREPNINLNYFSYVPMIRNLRANPGLKEKLLRILMGGALGKDINALATEENISQDEVRAYINMLRDIEKNPELITKLKKFI